MLQRSKPQRSSRRSARPAQVAAPEADATAPADSAPAAGEDPAAAEQADDAAAAAAPAEAAPDAAPTVAVGAPAEDAAAGTPPAVELALPTASPAAESAALTASPAAEPAAVVPETAPVDVVSAVETTPVGIVPAGNPVPAVPPGAPPAPTTDQSRALVAQRFTMMETSMQQANKAAETMVKAAEEAAEFGRGNVEAFTKATQIYVAGLQDLGKQTFAVVQGLTDHAMEGAKALSAVKSLQEAVQIQSNYARAAIEKTVSESAKLGESALKLTEQTFAPITARFTLAAEKLTRVPAAA